MIKKNNKHSNDYIDQIIDLRDQGSNARQIAELLGVTRNSIIGILYRWSGSVKTNNKVTSTFNERLSKLDSLL